MLHLGESPPRGAISACMLKSISGVAETHLCDGGHRLQASPLVLSVDLIYKTPSGLHLYQHSAKHVAPQPRQADVQ